MSRQWSLIHNDAATTTVLAGGCCYHRGGWSQASNAIFQLGDLNTKDSQAQNSSNC
jgi:hypothetical protein